MNLNVLDNLLYKRKNVLAHPLSSDVQPTAKRKTERAEVGQTRETLVEDLALICGWLLYVTVSKQSSPDEKVSSASK